MYRKTKTLIFIIGVLVGVLVNCTPSANATSYGGSGYGKCYYAKGCPTGSTPATPVPATPQQPIQQPSGTPTISVGLNLTPGQVVSQKSQIVIATYYRAQNGSQATIPATEIGWTAFYVENKLIGTIYNSTDSKTFEISWRPQKSGPQTVSAVGYDHTGNAIARIDINVTVARSAINKSTSTTTTTTKQDTNTPTARDDSTTNNGSGLDITAFENVSFPKKIQDLPMFMLRTYPVWLFIILFIISVRYWWRGIRKTITLRDLQKSIAHEQHLTHGKLTFVLLLCQNLYASLGLLRKSTEVLASTPDQVKSAFWNAVDEMKLSIERVTNAVADSQNAPAVQIPTQSKSSFNPFTSKDFWIPVFAVLSATILVNVVLFMLDQSSFAIGNVWFRLLVLIVGVVFLALTIRTYYTREAACVSARQVLSYTQDLDTTQTRHIQLASSNLRDGVAKIDAARQQFTNNKMTKNFDQKLAQIDDDIHKLQLSLLATNQIAHVGSFAAVPMHQVFAQAFESRQPMIANQSLRIENQICHLSVPCDPQLLNFIAEALVDNSIKYTNPGGSIYVREITNGFTFEDNGIGMSAHVLSSLFAPLTQTTPAPESTHEDTDSGLALCKIIVERVGGSLSISSTEGRGTKITVMFS